MIETAAAINPHAVAVHRLPPKLRRSYDSWRAENDAIYARIEATEGEGASYARLIDGEDVSLPMPIDVAQALSVPAMPVFSQDSTLEELERQFAAMVRTDVEQTSKR